MAFMYYEGTTDYLAATPALIITNKASGSITAGRFLAFDRGTSESVYQPSGVPSGSLMPAGIALQTVSDGDPIAVGIFGLFKNLPVLGGVKAGNYLVVTGSGYWGVSGSSTTADPVSTLAMWAGRCITGSTSGGTVVAFISI